MLEYNYVFLSKSRLEYHVQQKPSFAFRQTSFLLPRLRGLFTLELTMPSTLLKKQTEDIF